QDGENYIIPVDFEPDSDLYVRAFSTSNLREQIQGKSAAFQLWMMDSVPSSASRALHAVTEGFAPPTNLPANVLVLLGSQPDRAGPELGTRKSGLLAVAFSSEFTARGVDLADLFDRVRRRVGTESGNAQLPWITNNILCSYMLREPP